MIGWSLQQNIRDRIQTFILVIILSWKKMLSPKPAEVYSTIFSTCCWDGSKAYVSVYLNVSVTCYTHIKKTLDSVCTADNLNQNLSKYIPVPEEVIPIFDS